MADSGRAGRVVFLHTGGGAEDCLHRTEHLVRGHHRQQCRREQSVGSGKQKLSDKNFSI